MGLEDAHERFSVGDQVLVRVLGVRRDSLEEVAVKADIKSVSQNTSHDNLKKCRIQSKYAGKVTDVHKGVVYIVIRQIIWSRFRQFIWMCSQVQIAYWSG